VFAGRVTDDALVAHYHAADVVCLPSVTIAEAFGMVLLEAMACGKPLVTTTLPTGVSAINRDGDTGLAVPPGNAGALREALTALLGDPARREALGRAARAVLEREYTAAVMAERFAALYGEVGG
jgi:rhamnosyl/mannosyltransferase